MYRKYISLKLYLFIFLYYAYVYGFPCNLADKNSLINENKKNLEPNIKNLEIIHYKNILIFPSRVALILF